MNVTKTAQNRRRRHRYHHLLSLCTVLLFHSQSRLWQKLLVFRVWFRVWFKSFWIVLIDVNFINRSITTKCKCRSCRESSLLRTVASIVVWAVTVITMFFLFIVLMLSIDRSCTIRRARWFNQCRRSKRWCSRKGHSFECLTLNRFFSSCIIKCHLLTLVFTKLLFVHLTILVVDVHQIVFDFFEKGYLTYSKGLDSAKTRRKLVF